MPTLQPSRTNLRVCTGDTSCRNYDTAYALKSAANMMEFSQIACEICRTKKRKCDRKIPTCSQCIHAGQTCTYPGTSKRGLPSGYIASIEDRLAQTEAALLQALSTIHGSQVESRSPPAIPEKPRDMEFNEVRIAKVEEWQKYPLDTEEHQRNWMQYKLATNPGSSALTILNTQEGHAGQASDKQQSQSHQKSDAARKRQKIANESPQNRQLPQGHRSDFASEALPLTGAQALQGGSEWTTNAPQGRPLDPDHGFATSIPSAQGTTTRSTDSHRASNPRSMPTPIRSNGVEALPDSDQNTSKAKRLSTLHSRKYF
ncbi:hypothetical protein KCU81_g3602, partial [Aureobasidium melanogenum]|uniref:Zn(2)-C6 fungal-type domain-containing protein n=1 Tax=Aureobasidium melanogenum (strain CBS 110374) TaxID=1043003 RepID=A0A074WDC3_AURM1